MTESCQRRFDEDLLSGYLDGALNQTEAQRVRLHLEDCHECQTLYEELKTVRDVSRTTDFHLPEEHGWPELPRGSGSLVSRYLGWVLIVSWLLVSAGVSLWRFFSESHHPLETFLMLGVPGGLALLLLSVLIDRLRDLKTDRYRGVER